MTPPSLAPPLPREEEEAVEEDPEEEEDGVERVRVEVEEWRRY